MKSTIIQDFRSGRDVKIMESSFARQLHASFGNIALHQHLVNFQKFGDEPWDVLIQEGP